MKGDPEALLIAIEKVMTNPTQREALLENSDAVWELLARAGNREAEAVVTGSKPADSRGRKPVLHAFQFAAVCFMLPAIRSGTTPMRAAAKVTKLWRDHDVPGLRALSTEEACSFYRDAERRRGMAWGAALRFLREEEAFCWTDEEAEAQTRYWVQALHRVAHRAEDEEERRRTLETAAVIEELGLTVVLMG